jgi:hypothetical protein
VNVIAAMTLFRPRRRLTAEKRNALHVLASSRDGCSQSIMMAHGLPLGVLRQIVRDGFARENREAKDGGTGPIVVTILQITAQGRLALADK